MRRHAATRRTNTAGDSPTLRSDRNTLSPGESAATNGNGGEYTRTSAGSAPQTDLSLAQNGVSLAPPIDDVVALGEPTTARPRGADTGLLPSVLQRSCGGTLTPFDSSLPPTAQATMATFVSGSGVVVESEDRSNHDRAETPAITPQTTPSRSAETVDRLGGRGF